MKCRGAPAILHTRNRHRCRVYLTSDPARGDEGRCALTISTDDVREDEQFGYWRETLCDAATRLTPERDEAGPFRAWARGRAFGGAIVSEGSAPRYRLPRTRADLARLGSPDYLLMVRLAADARYAIGKQELLVREGDTLLIDSSAFRRSAYSGDMRCGAIRIPRHLLRPTSPLPTQHRSLISGRPTRSAASMRATSSWEHAAAASINSPQRTTGRWDSIVNCNDRGLCGNPAVGNSLFVLGNLQNDMVNPGIVIHVENGFRGIVEIELSISNHGDGSANIQMRTPGHLILNRFVRHPDLQDDCGRLQCAFVRRTFNLADDASTPDDILAHDIIINTDGADAVFIDRIIFHDLILPEENTPPIAVAEPSSALILAGAGLTALLRRRRG
jgi:hypothetical protein